MLISIYLSFGRKGVTVILISMDLLFYNELFSGINKHTTVMHTVLSWDISDVSTHSKI